jgi:hypothetical protein
MPLNTNPSVFNFARTLKSIYLNLDLDAPPCRLG